MLRIVSILFLFFILLGCTPKSPPLSEIKTLTYTKKPKDKSPLHSQP